MTGFMLALVVIVLFGVLLVAGILTMSRQDDNDYGDDW